jgi:hypothetical protein
VQFLDGIITALFVSQSISHYSPPGISGSYCCTIFWSGASKLSPAHFWDLTNLWVCFETLIVVSDFDTISTCAVAGINVCSMINLPHVGIIVFLYGEFGEIGPLSTDMAALVRLISDTS